MSPRLGAASLTQTLAKPSREACSKTDEDCWSTGCCDVSGYTCYQTTEGMGQCMKNCTPSDKRLCTMPQPITDKIMQDAEWYGPSMYCFAYAMQDVGSTKPYYELQLLAGQYQKQIGIFACEQWGAFSDKDGELAPGVPIVKVNDVDGDFHFAKRKSFGTWINTGHFTQVWKTIYESGAIGADITWVVKLDADAVFVPSRLVPFLSDQWVPTKGIYLENCKAVKYGWFGNLEIMSRAAFDTLAQNVDWCKENLDWKVGVEGGKYGPMGEDLFAQSCLDKFDIRRGEAFQTRTDGACEADRPEGEKKNKKWVPNCVETKTAQYHPLMKPDDFFACYDNTIAKFGYQ